MRECEKCDGTGRISCGACWHGQRKCACPDCNGSGAAGTCPRCRGRGKITPGSCPVCGNSISCPTCKGSGAL